MGNRFTNLNADNAILDSLKRFQGFYGNVYRDPFVTGTSFVFMTKPLLFLEPYAGAKTQNDYGELAYLNMTRDPIFTQYLADQALSEADREIIKMLSFNKEHTDSYFLPIITNECKNFDAEDIRLEQNDAFDTKQGFKETLPTHKTQSEASNTINISVTEDSNLTFTKMMTLWINYITNITDGTFDANPNMVLNGVLDYTTSIFYFVLAPDGKTLKYWAKYTGCWPTTIPYGSFKYSKGQNDLSDINLSFVYNIKEDMSPKILEEFNMLSLKLPGSIVLKDRLYVTEVSGEYTSIKDSPLLNLNEMSKLPGANVLLKSEKRDPLVVYIPDDSNFSINNDTLSSHFELIFDDYGYKSNLIPDIFGIDNYYINDKATNQFIKDGTYNNKSWDQTDYWLEETIDNLKEE